jgi:hypothetical protein
MRASPWAMLMALFCSASANALERVDTEFMIYQFPADRIPRMDGDPGDWADVPEEYAIRTDQLRDDNRRYDAPDPANLDVSVKVGWVRGENRLYFLYEAYDDYWDFSRPGLRNDTFEVVVDGDLSGGPLIDRFRENAASLSEGDAWWSMHGAHAQNYHIFTPARDKDWTMLWGPAQWVKRLPYANAAYSYGFQPGESGRLTLEFWITPFDYAGAEGPERAVASVLTESKLIGLAWAIIDYDDGTNGFWNLSTEHTMFGQASQLVGFRLMPLEASPAAPIQADWSFRILDRSRRLVAFQDQSRGEVHSWHWDFGDGQTSEDKHPVHVYTNPGHYVVVLRISGPGGVSTLSRVWDVTLR